MNSTAGTAEAPTADDLETTVRLMAKIGSCWSPSFSPDEERLAFVSNLGGVPQVWTVPVTGGWPEPVTALDDQVSSVTWSPTGEWLAFALAPGGGMNQQVYLVRPDGTGLQRITDGGKENNRLGRWTHDGRRLMIASNRRNPDRLDAYLFDTVSGELRLVAENPGVGSLLDVSRDGRHCLLYRMAQRGDNNVFLLDIETGHETLLTPHEGPGSFEHCRFAPDGRTVYLSSNQDRDLVAFARIELVDGHAPGPIQPLAEREDAELAGFEVSFDGVTVVLVWNVAGQSELEFIDLRSLERSPGPELPRDVVWSVGFSRDDRFLCLHISRSATPDDVYVLERETGNLSQVTHSPHAGVRLDTLVRPELVEFRAHDDLRVTGWLYTPREYGRPGPVVLSFHGGPEGQEVPRFDSTYQALLAQGIAVLAPNVRGSSGFGKEFVNLDNGQLRVNAVRDIEACVSYVVGAGIADPRRIGIMGGSYGGYMTMAGLAGYPEVFAAGANLFGVVNFATFFEHTEPWMAAISKAEYGDPDTEAEMLRELSPIHKLDRVTAPTLVLHGANDTNVPVIEAEQVVQSLRQRDVPVEYVLFPDEGHGFTKTSNQVRATVQIVRWFAKHLGAGD